MLTKKIEIDQIEVTRDGHVQVRSVTIIEEDGVLIGKSLHRHVIAPGDDYSSEDVKVQAICAVAHTDKVVSEYKASQTAKGA